MVFFCLTLSPVFAGENAIQHNETLRLNLEQTVELGLERNARLQARDFAIEKSHSEVKSARGGFLPKFSAGYSRTYLDSLETSGPADADYLDQVQDTWRMRLVQTIFAGKTILNSYQRAQIAEEISRLERQGEERELIRRIQENFLLLLKAREDQSSLEQTVGRLEVSREAAEAFASKQMLAYVEVLQAQVDLEEARQQMGQAENLETIYKTRLDALLDFEIDRNIYYTGELADIDLQKVFDLDYCLRTALEERIDLKFIESRIRIAEKDKAIARGRKMPRVTLEASAVDQTRDFSQQGTDMFGQVYDRDQENRYWTVGVNVEWNFFSGGEHYYRQQSMDFEAKRLQRLYEDAAATIRTDVRSAYLRLQEARQRIDATRVNLETAQEGYQMEEERFKRRVGTIQDLLNAQDRLTRAEASKNQALLDYQRALADLYFAMGIINYALN